MAGDLVYNVIRNVLPSSAQKSKQSDCLHVENGRQHYASKEDLTSAGHRWSGKTVLKASKSGP